MMVIVGWLVALGCIFGAYVAIGGPIAALIQPTKFIMIFGGALGAFIAANSAHALKHTISGL